MLEAECMLLNSVSSSQKKDEISEVLRMTREPQNCDYENACLRRIRNVAQVSEPAIWQTGQVET